MTINTTYANILSKTNAYAAASLTAKKSDINFALCYSTHNGYGRALEFIAISVPASELPDLVSAYTSEYPGIIGLAAQHAVKWKTATAKKCFKDAKAPTSIISVLKNGGCILSCGTEIFMPLELAGVETVSVSFPHGYDLCGPRVWKFTAA